MKICGLQKTTLLDFPGKVAATVFLGGCNFRCPFCHNSQLLSGDAEELLSKENLLDFLKKRAGMLEGVCITGGEPTLFAQELEDLIRQIRDLGYLVKLDTNGYQPSVLRRLMEEQLLDYVAMDLKSGPEHYEIAAGVPGISLERIEESVNLLLCGSVPFEFRTTVVKGLHTGEDFADLARWLGDLNRRRRGDTIDPTHGADAEKLPPIRYFLQGFVDSGHVLEDGFSAFTKEELLEFLDIVKPQIPLAEIRGVEY